VKNRKEDIPLLAYHFLEPCTQKKAKKEIKGISKEAMKLLLEYHWRECQRIRKTPSPRAVIMTD